MRVFARRSCSGCVNSNLYLRHDVARHVALQRQNIRDGAFVAVRPKILARLRLHQFRGNAHAIVGAQHRAFHQRVHAQFLRDLRGAFVLVLVLHHRSARDHAQFLDLRKLSDQRVGHSVGEIILFGIASEILQRQHRQRLNGRRANGRRSAPLYLNELSRQTRLSIATPPPPK